MTCDRRYDRRHLVEQLGSRYPGIRVGTIEGVAGAVVYVASSEACWLTGQVLAVIGARITA
ncbi:MAG TPA: hypothetical protein VFO62_02520 [Candidatus Binatia bacterium]|nr:hypothetical protein [Candidatus Binatia bacterium]